MGAEVGVTDAPSLEVVFGVAAAAGSDLSGMLTAPKSLLLSLRLLQVELEIRSLVQKNQSSPFVPHLQSHSSPPCFWGCLSQEKTWQAAVQ